MLKKLNGSTVQTYAYEFDDFGNRTSLTATGENAYTTAYSYDANNRLLEDVKTEAGAETKTTYFYDPNGNQTGKSIETLTASSDAESTSLTNEIASYELSWYNGFNQLVGTKANGITAEYSYAPSGLRLSKTIGDVQTNFVLDGGNVIAEQRGETLTAYYARGVNLFASFIGSTTNFYLYNAHGDVVQLTDENGAVTKTYEYDAFGNEQEQSASDTNPFRYCGEYYDAETGTYYLRARYYDPAIGRFTQMDNVLYVFHEFSNGSQVADPLSLNLYTYCAANPIQYQDPSGNFWETVIDVIGLAWSIHDAFVDPTWMNIAACFIDAGAVIIPFVSGTAGWKAITKTGKAVTGSLVVKATDKASDLVQAFKKLPLVDRIASTKNGAVILSYKAFDSLLKGRSKFGVEVHHLIEKRFAKTLGISSDDILSIAIDSKTHNSITQLMRDAIHLNPGGRSVPKAGIKYTFNATPQDIWNATVQTYTQLGMTEYLPLLKDQLLSSASNADKITDWLGW